MDATIARRNGENWFFGSLTVKDRKLDIPLSFLDSGETYQTIIYSQNAKELKDNTVGIETILVNQKTVLSRDLLSDSGLAVIIRKI